MYNNVLLLIYQTYYSVCLQKNHFDKINNKHFQKHEDTNL